MWIVYNKHCGFEVPTESEAIEWCKEHRDYKYYWMGKR